jgi:hypothetical protein
VITIDAGTLAGTNDLPADLAGHGAITAQAARDLARHAGTADLLILGKPPCGSHPPPGQQPPGQDPPETQSDPAPPHAPGNPDHPNSPGSPGHPGSPAPYRPATAQLRDVIARHRTCRAPGCNRRAEQCDIDHVRPYNGGGKTCPCNLLPLCRHHHRLKTFAGWHLTLGPADGAAPTIHWTSPTGRHYDVPPPDQPGTPHW